VLDLDASAPGGHRGPARHVAVAVGPRWFRRERLAPLRPAEPRVGLGRAFYAPRRPRRRARSRSRCGGDLARSALIGGRATWRAACDHPLDRSTSGSAIVNHSRAAKHGLALGQRLLGIDAEHRVHRTSCESPALRCRSSRPAAPVTAEHATRAAFERRPRAADRRMTRPGR
jgi:hypothetical protein